MEYIKPERLWLRQHQELGEKWVQERIANDPAILGLGDLELRESEKVLPGGGRLDLLLQDPESSRRYEVEIQLGKTNESHIIRTLEYWDIEKRRYPKHEHCAVIVAEEITGRFLNVVSLFNGHIPLIALQMSAYQFGDNISLLFTKVLGEVTLGDDPPDPPDPVDRSYWEEKGSKQTVAIADELLTLVQEIAPGYELKFNKPYIGLALNSQANNFALLWAKKDFLRLALRIDQSDELTQRVESSGLDFMNYNASGGRYRFRLSPGDVAKHNQLLVDLLKMAYLRSIGESE